MNRCTWPGADPLMLDYHDHEWGLPAHDDQRLFEMLLLEGAQAGLSWITILRKRENYRLAFDGFDPRRIAAYDDDKVAALLANPGIVRNRLKVAAFIKNAAAFLETQAEFGSFDRYIWQFVGGQPIINQFQHLGEIPAVVPQAEAMSKDLKLRGFTFVGPTICYAFMQACGMVNDHLVTCFRHTEVQQTG
ncbi:MAG: DNA-3-methyladenine glycosylase I [Anaerolineae bacterium]|nr:MAG: DNA-3-methyladenine glycosylase I [Anaerolineae bacterium]